MALKEKILFQCNGFLKHLRSRSESTSRQDSGGYRVNTDLRNTPKHQISKSRKKVHDHFKWAAIFFSLPYGIVFKKILVLIKMGIIFYVPSSYHQFQCRSRLVKNTWHLTRLLKMSLSPSGVFFLLAFAFLLFLCKEGNNRKANQIRKINKSERRKKSNEEGRKKIVEKIVKKSI